MDDPALFTVYLICKSTFNNLQLINNIANFKIAQPMLVQYQTKIHRILICAIMSLYFALNKIPQCLLSFCVKVQYMASTHQNILIRIKCEK